MSNCEPFRGLLVGLLDGELTPDETRQINDHLTRCATCRTEYEQLRETSGKLAAISFREPDDAVLAQVWKSPFSRLARNTSLVLIIERVRPSGVVQSCMYPSDPLRVWITGKCVIFTPFLR